MVNASPPTQTNSLPYIYFVAGDALTDEAGEAGAEAGAAGEGCGVGVGVAVASGSVDCKTECVPVTAGSESINAISMKQAAAPIVIFARMLAVPRGPKAALETLLEKRSPAPDLPGWSRMTMTSTTQARINSPYKV